MIRPNCHNLVPTDFAQVGTAQASDVSGDNLNPSQRPNLSSLRINDDHKYRIRVEGGRGRDVGTNHSLPTSNQRVSSVPTSPKRGWDGSQVGTALTAVQVQA